MQTVPLDVSEPFVSLDVFGIIGIDVASSIVLVSASGRFDLQFVPSGAKTMLFLLEHTSN